jgi:hypothetical protein
MDENVLSEELRSLMDDGFDISVLGYSEEDLQALEDGWAPDEGLLDTKEGTSESEAVVRVKCKYADVDKVVEAVRDAVKKSKLKDVEVVRP